MSHTRTTINFALKFPRRFHPYGGIRMVKHVVSGGVPDCHNGGRHSNGKATKLLGMGGKMGWTARFGHLLASIRKWWPGVVGWARTADLDPVTRAGFRRTAWLPSARDRRG
ncbi:hypothetical protein GCM10027436_52660 [Actinophytocola sediminis]